MIIYCGTTYGLAQHLASILKISRPTLSLVLMDGDYAHNVVIPYIAEAIDLAIVYSDVAHEKSVARLLHSTMANSIGSIFIVPSIVYEKQKALWSREFEDMDLIEVDNDIYRLTLLLTALKVGINIGGAIARISRIKSELNISSVVGDVLDAYRSTIEMMRFHRNILVSKAMLPLGEYLEDYSYSVYIVDTQLGTQLARFSSSSETFIVVYSSAEDHIVNEFIMETLRKGFHREQFVSFRINTDPFTAPIYGILASMAAVSRSW